MLNEITSDAEKKFKSSLEYFKGELAMIRSTQTSPALVENITIEAYGGSYPLIELAAISVPEANVILIQPWDQTIIQNIETAILNSEIGIKPAVDGIILRLSTPPLSLERRNEMIKKVNIKSEEVKIAIRNVRQDKMKTIDNLEKEDAISKDEREYTRKQVQKLVEQYNLEIDELKKNKNKSLEEI